MNARYHALFPQTCAMIRHSTDWCRASVQQHILPRSDPSTPLGQDPNEGSPPSLLPCFSWIQGPHCTALTLALQQQLFPAGGQSTDSCRVVSPPSRPLPSADPNGLPGPLYGTPGAGPDCEAASPQLPTPHPPGGPRAWDAAGH